MKNKYNFKKIKAVIWDMDGVLSDTQKFHAEAESLLLEDFQIFIKPENITKEYAGVADEKMFAEIFLKYGRKNQNLKELIFQKWNLMKKITNDRIEAIPHATKLVKKLKENNYSLAIASASNTNFIMHVLNSLKVEHYFDAIVSAQEVINGKPAPDIFLLAAQKINTKPEDCLVLEDGISGMIGAKKAGMLSIGLVEKKSIKTPADINIEKLEEIEKILNLN